MIRYKTKQWIIIAKIIANKDERKTLRQIMTSFISTATERDLNYLSRPANANAKTGPLTNKIALAQQIELALERLDKPNELARAHTKATRRNIRNKHRHTNN